MSMVSPELAPQIRKREASPLPELSRAVFSDLIENIKMKAQCIFLISAWKIICGQMVSSSGGVPRILVASECGTQTFSGCIWAVLTSS
jgi:hypothetical protein